MNAKLKLYMKKKNTEKFFKEFNFKCHVVDQSPPSEFYKEIFSRVNVVGDFNDMGCTIDTFVSQFVEISSKSSNNTWLLLFNNKDGDINVVVELDVNGDVLKKIIESSVTSNGFLDDFVMLSESGVAICISKNEYNYSVGRDKSESYVGVYSLLVSGSLP